MQKIKHEVFIKFPNWGLGNLMLIWAKGLVFSHINNFPLIVSPWWGIRPGAIFRNEKSKRIYWNYFKESSLLSLCKVYFHSLTYQKVREPAVLKYDKALSPTLFIFNDLILDPNPFEVLEQHRLVVKEALMKMLSDTVRCNLARQESPTIGVHIRRGDFKKGSTITPLEFYIDAIKLVRKNFGQDLKVTVFTDASVREISPVLQMENVICAGKNPDIVDIILLSQSRYIILSAGSTFSYWAAFLSSAIVIRPKDWMSRICQDRQDGYREIITDFSIDPAFSFSKNIL